MLSTEEHKIVLKVVYSFALDGVQEDCSPSHCMKTYIRFSCTGSIENKWRFVVYSLRYHSSSVRA